MTKSDVLSDPKTLEAFADFCETTGYQGQIEQITRSQILQYAS